MHPYRDFISCRCITFTPFSTRTFFLCLGFTLHMMSTNLPSIFSKMNLSYGMSELRYALGISKTSTSLHSCESIMSLVNRVSREMIGEDASSLIFYNLWVHPSAYALPFSFLICFSFVRFIPCSYPLFYDIMRLPGSSSPITFMYSDCVYYVYIVATSLSLHVYQYPSCISSVWTSHPWIFFSCRA